MHLYVTSLLTIRGEFDPNASIQTIPRRADAAEVRFSEAVLLKARAEKKWPKFQWQLDKTYSGKFVVRGERESDA